MGDGFQGKAATGANKLLLTEKPISGIPEILEIHPYTQISYSGNSLLKRCYKDNWKKGGLSHKEGLGHMFVYMEG